MRYTQPNKIEKIHNLVIDDNIRLERPYMYTIREIKDDIYHVLGSDKYKAFNLNYSTVKAYKSDISSSVIFDNYKMIKWREYYHIDLYIIGSKTQEKYELVCTGYMNENIPFTLLSGDKLDIKINSYAYSLEKTQDHNFRIDSYKRTRRKFNTNEFSTNGYKYKIFSFNFSEQIDNIEISYN